MTKPRTKLSEAPVVFGRRLSATKPIDDESRAWRMRTGQMLIRVSVWGEDEWNAELNFQGMRLLDVFGTCESVTRGLERFLTALKRATEGVP